LVSKVFNFNFQLLNLSLSFKQSSLQIVLFASCDTHVMLDIAKVLSLLFKHDLGIS
jgi:hypothetical protein